MDAHMQMIVICQEFGWTYDEYINQPNFFLTLIKEKLIRDKKEQDLELKKMKRGK